MTQEETLKALQAAEKALRDTKAYATKLAQDLAATNAVVETLETVGVRIPTEIEALKETNAEEYATKLEQYKAEVKKKQEEAARKAKEEAAKKLLEEAAKSSDVEPSKIDKLVPPIVYEQYKEGKIDANKLVELAIQYENATKTVDSPTTTDEFDFTTVAGATQVSKQKHEKDKTLDPSNYIL